MVRYIESPSCHRCAYPFAGAITSEFTCSYCHNLKFYFQRAVCACRADGVVREAIHRLKYKREMYFEYHLSEWLFRAGTERIDWSSVDLLVPVPLHPRKQRERDFNQAELLAKKLSTKVRVNLILDNLLRIRDTTTQTSLDAKARFNNMRDSFIITDSSIFNGKKVVLLDDVFTTGATMNSCARVLHHAGVKEIIALAVARGV